MTKLNRFAQLTLGAIIALASFLVEGRAQHEWQILPAKSTLTFTATQNGAPVTGQFTSFTGKILVDPANYQASHIQIVVDMNSLSVSYADLKSTLVTADWFNVNLFPTAEFNATQFNKLSNKTYEAKGTLTIRDKTAPVTLTFTAEEINGQALVLGSTLLKRSVFGVGQGEWASTDEIKDDVQVNFKVEAIPKPGNE